AAVSGPNHVAVLGLPAGVRGTNIFPPIWPGSTPVSDPANWPIWGTLPDRYPHWPLWMTNVDGILVVVPSAVSPLCDASRSGSNLSITLQGLPGNYALQTKTAL